jgi:hypothetical protein
MNSLIVEPTELTPGVRFIPSTFEFEISGESRPENVRKFYEPLMEWLDQYKVWLKSNKPGSTGKLVFKFKFQYFNSTSAKFLTSIIARLDAISKEIMPLEIEWYYDTPDVDMKNSGEEFSKMFSLPFHFYSVELM